METNGRLGALIAAHARGEDSGRIGCMGDHACASTHASSQLKAKAAGKRELRLQNRLPS